jgi:hypothetical protein
LRASKRAKLPLPFPIIFLGFLFFLLSICLPGGCLKNGGGCRPIQVVQQENKQPEEIQTHVSPSRNEPDKSPPSAVVAEMEKAERVRLFQSRSRHLNFMIYYRINKVRKAHNLGVLAWDSDLEQIA